MKGLFIEETKQWAQSFWQSPAPVVAAEDYRRMATLGFKGGIMAKAEMAMIAVKTMRD